MSRYRTGKHVSERTALYIGLLKKEFEPMEDIYQSRITSRSVLNSAISIRVA
jgi:hypothetical protein